MTEAYEKVKYERDSLLLYSEDLKIKNDQLNLIDQQVIYPLQLSYEKIIEEKYELKIVIENLEIKLNENLKQIQE